MYIFILIEVQSTRLVSIRPFLTLVVISTTNMVGAPSISQPDLDTFMYYVFYSIFMYLYLNLYSSYHLISSAWSSSSHSIQILYYYSTTTTIFSKYSP